MLLAEDYRELFESAIPTASDADTIETNPTTLFTPKQHRLALDPNVTIVQGGRGVGKTVWFDALQDEQMRRIAVEQYSLPALDRLDPTAGFGARLNRQYPGSRALAALLDDGFTAEDIWSAVALHNFGVADVQRLPDWASRVTWVRDHPEAFEESLLALDEEAGSTNSTRLLLFDALDRLHNDRAKADALTSGILRLALTLRTSTRHLRAKVFIRRDMFESAGTDFPDASKLINNQVDLRWDDSSLYSLLFHLMSSADTPYADRFSQEASWQPRKVGGREELERVLLLVASPHMGNNHRKGFTYTWIPNHLADGRGQVSPRSFLSALARAAARTSQEFITYPKALHWDAIRQGVQHASEIRVREVREDTPWVQDALEPLRGQQVPIEPQTVISLWRGADLRTTLERQKSPAGVDEDDEEFRTGPSRTDYDGLIEELKDFGMFTVRADGRLDLPDVYRIAFGVGRKGGVPLARA